MSKNLASREPYWDELSDTNKIERMHEVLKTQKRAIERLLSEVEKLTEHSHNSSGEILIPYSSKRGMPEQYASHSDRYF